MTMKCFISLEYCGILYSLYGAWKSFWVALEIDTKDEEHLEIFSGWPR